MLWLDDVTVINKSELLKIFKPHIFYVHLFYCYNNIKNVLINKSTEFPDSGLVDTVDLYNTATVMYLNEFTIKIISIMIKLSFAYQNCQAWTGLIND